MFVWLFFSCAWHTTSCSILVFHFSLVLSKVIYVPTYLGSNLFIILLIAPVSKVLEAHQNNCVVLKNAQDISKRLSETPVRYIRSLQNGEGKRIDTNHRKYGLVPNVMCFWLTIRHCFKDVVEIYEDVYHVRLTVMSIFLNFLFLFVRIEWLQ